MEKVIAYQQYVREIFQQFVDERSQQDDDVEVELTIDPERRHYHIFNVGWQDEHRIYGCVLHVDIKNDKIWIQHDGTEDGIANAFLERGVPKSDIVLAFHSPFKRQFSGFAVA